MSNELCLNPYRTLHDAYIKYFFHSNDTSYKILSRNIEALISFNINNPLTEIF